MRDPAHKPIWAKWRVTEDGGVAVVATYLEAGSYVRRELEFDSLSDAAATLGPSFGDVVARATEAGSRAGRWRP